MKVITLGNADGRAECAAQRNSVFALTAERSEAGRRWRIRLGPTHPTGHRRPLSVGGSRSVSPPRDAGNTRIART